MWAKEQTRFLKGSGFTKSIVDRRLFLMFDEERRELLLGTFFLNYKLVVQSEPMAARFNKELEKKFSDKGLPGTQVWQCFVRRDRDQLRQVLGDLSGKLVGMILMSPGPRCTNPLSEGFLRQLEAGPGPDYEFLPRTPPFPGPAAPWGWGRVGRRPREAGRFFSATPR